MIMMIVTQFIQMELTSYTVLSNLQLLSFKFSFSFLILDARVIFIVSYIISPARERESQKKDLPVNDITKD